MANAIIHTPKDIKSMRRVGQLAADTLALVEQNLAPGMTTADINAMVHAHTLENGARPAPLNYKGFPASVCTSVNEVVCHGIPGDPGGHLGDIGAAIQTYAEAKGCSVVRDYTGHGIGRTFHGPPSVSHVGVRGTGLRLKRGMTFTIEPMINVGGYTIDHLDDGWTVVTRDGSLSAQFEHTVVVTRDGVEILTLPTQWEGSRRLAYDPEWRP